MNLFKSFLCFLLWIPFTGHAQKSTAAKAVVSFTVRAPAKEISGENDDAWIEINYKSGRVKAGVLVDSFRFQNNFTAEKMNAIIRQRFREYYMESAQHPLIAFEGRIDDLKTIMHKKRGSYPVTMSGYLTIHGIKKHIDIKAVLTVNGAHRSMTADLIVVPKDYNIRLPEYIGYMYFKQVNIKIAVTL